MVGAMIRLEAALGPYVTKMRTEVPNHATGPE